MFRPEALKDKGRRWHCYREPTYTVLLDQNAQAYMASLSSNTRKTYTKKKNKLERSASWSVQHYHGLEALAHWDAFLTLEHSGWKGEGETSIKSLSENYQCFYRGFVEQLARSGALWITLLWYEDNPIAAAFMYREADILHMFKAGYDANYHSLSPSNILLVELIKFIAESYDGLKVLNCFPSDFGYKHKFMQQEYECYTLVMYSGSLRGRLLYQFSKLKTMVKNIVKYKP